MGLKKLESEKEAEFNRRRLEKLVSRITKIEEYLACPLNMNAKGLADLLGANSCGTPRLMSSEGCSRKFSRPPSAAGDIVNRKRRRNKPWSSSPHFEWGRT